MFGCAEVEARIGSRSSVKRYGPRQFVLTSRSFLCHRFLSDLFATVTIDLRSLDTTHLFVLGSWWWRHYSYIVDQYIKSILPFQETLGRRAYCAEIGKIDDHCVDPTVPLLVTIDRLRLGEYSFDGTIAASLRSSRDVHGRLFEIKYICELVSDARCCVSDDVYLPIQRRNVLFRELRRLWRNELGQS